jgi:hypothetical protein
MARPARAQPPVHYAAHGCPVLSALDEGRYVPE